MVACVSRCLLALLMGTVLFVAPFAYYRCQYTEHKRLRVVTPGVLYRSGQMTRAGIAEAVQRFGIRTVVNFQNESPDPKLSDGLAESELLEQLGVRYIYLVPDLLPRLSIPERRPEAIDAFLKIMDDPANHPVLIHCRGGLHRAGLFTAIYRMEYENWTLAAAIAELKENGFSRTKCSARNDYIMQYLLIYQKRPSGSVHVARQGTRDD